MIKTGVAYFGNRFPAHAERDLAEIAECCDYVVHTVSEADFYFHKAALAKIFAASRRRGLEVWADPWGVGGVFGGEALSKFLTDHPADWQVLSDRRRIPAACPNSSAFRNFVREWVLTVQDAGAQVVFWDEPHVYFHWSKEWEGLYACTCERCQTLYAQWFGGDMPERLDDTAREFRRLSLHGFLDEMMQFAARKRLRNALCLYAFEGYAEYDHLWRELSAIPKLDIFGCDPYWRWRPRWTSVLSSEKARRIQDPADYVRYFSERVLRETVPAGKGSQIWIQAMRLPAGAEKEIAGACRAAAKAGVTHLAAWSFDGGELLDPVLAERPGKIRAEVARVFRALRSR